MWWFPLLGIVPLLLSVGQSPTVSAFSSPHLSSTFQPRNTVKETYRLSQNQSNRHPPFILQPHTTPYQQRNTNVSLKALSPRAIHTFITSGSGDVAAVITGCSILALYHLQLYRVETQGTKRTWRSSQADNREKWSRYVRDTEGWLYAVQTLRNAITAQTFLATTVVSLSTVITGRLWEIIRLLDETSDLRRNLVTQLVMVGVCMLTSAYHFLQSARLMTHAGFMFPVEKETTKVDKIMRKTQNAQYLGLRWLYLSFGMISWVIGGPFTFLGVSSLLTIFFQKIDRVPGEVDVVDVNPN